MTPPTGGTFRRIASGELGGYKREGHACFRRLHSDRRQLAGSGKSLFRVPCGDLTFFTEKFAEVCQRHGLVGLDI